MSIEEVMLLNVNTSIDSLCSYIYVAFMSNEELDVLNRQSQFREKLVLYTESPYISLS